MRRLLNLEDFDQPGLSEPDTGTMSSHSVPVSSAVHTQPPSFSFDPLEQVPSYESSQLLHRNSTTPNLLRHASLAESARLPRLTSDQQLHHHQYPLQADAGEIRHPLLSDPAAEEHSSHSTSNISHIRNHSHNSSSTNNNSSITLDIPTANISNSNNFNSNANSNSNLISTSTGSSANNTNANSSSHSSSARVDKKSLKRLGLKFLNARQHFLLACCRDLALVPCIYGLFQSWKRVVYLEQTNTVNVGGEVFESFTGARISEHFLTGVWCIVSGYLSYSVLDGLMVRWIVTYLTTAAIVRMLSMSTIMVTVEQYLVATFSAQGYSYGLHIWILISCCLTVMFVVQNFVTLNLDLKDGKVRARFFDFYKIAVFGVVPVGLASFITMIGLLRSLLILRLDLEVSGNAGKIV